MTVRAIHRSTEPGLQAVHVFPLMIEQPVACASAGLFAFPDPRRSMHTLLRLTCSITLVATAAGCASSGRAGAPARPDPVEAPSVVNLPPVVPPLAPAPAPAPFVYASGTYTYAVENEATIAATSGPARVDTVRSRSIITYRLSPRGDTTFVEGTVDSVSVSSTGSPQGMATATAGAGAVATGSFPFSFKISPNGVVRSPGRDSATVCASADIAAIATARDLLVSVPTLLAHGAQWTDSAVTTSCRGMIPVVTRAARTADVAWAIVPDTIRTAPDTIRTATGGGGLPAYRILRTSIATMGGEGQVAGRHITITGTGSSTNALYLEPLRGVFLGSIGDAVTRLFVDTGSERQEFEQRVRQRVVLLR